MKSKVIREAAILGAGVALVLAGNLMASRGGKVTGALVIGVGCLLVNSAVCEVAFAWPLAWEQRG